MLDRRFAEGAARTDHRMKERGAKWDFTRLSQRTWGKPGLDAMAPRVTPQLTRGGQRSGVSAAGGGAVGSQRGSVA